MLNHLNSCILTPSFSSDRETTSPSKRFLGFIPSPALELHFGPNFFDGSFDRKTISISFWIYYLHLFMVF